MWVICRIWGSETTTHTTQKSQNLKQDNNTNKKNTEDWGTARTKQ